MKILQLGKAYPPANLGGVEVVIQLLAEGLNKSGIECDALGVNDKFEFKIEAGIFGGKIYRTRLLKKAFSTLLSIQLITYLNRLKKNYDIVHIHSPDPMAALALLIVRPKCKIALHWHSDILKQKILLSFFRPIQNWLLNRADIIFATSPNYIEGSKDLSKYRNKVTVLPIGITIDKTPLSDCNNISPIISGKHVIFSLGRLAYYKGFEYLIKAAQYLNEDHLILIAGEGPERPKLEQIITKLDLKNKVKLLGKISEEEKQYLFTKADVFALSSIYKTEAYAIVQVEALAFGKPIVSTKIPGSGVDWVNLHNVSGYTVAIRDKCVSLCN